MATVQPSAAPGHPIPVWVERKRQEACQRVRGKMPAVWLWDQVLTPDDRHRLGDDLAAAYSRYGGAAGMWRHLRGVSTLRAVVAVATRLNLLDPDAGRAVLRAFGEEADDPELAVDAAVAAGGLVLVETPRRAYWEGTFIPIDWNLHTRPWVFLWEIARASKGGGAVDAFTFRDGAEPKPGLTKNLKHRLVKAAGFPCDLAVRVASAGRGSYRLDLPAARIRVFERGLEVVREWVA